ncbi:hypothetical protein [Algoriphagus aquimarinus]|uniref:hypothetical protein n=1 Tax=Algoriphagus aquimarinus TaxID=237018 RepID=UPI0030DD0EE0
MITRNDASRLTLISRLEDRYFDFAQYKQWVTDVASMLEFTKSYDVFVTLLTEKQIHIISN